MAKTEIFTYGRTERTVRGTCSNVQSMRDVADCLAEVAAELCAEAPKVADVTLTFTCTAQPTAVGAGKVEWQLDIKRATDGQQRAEQEEA